MGIPITICGEPAEFIPHSGHAVQPVPLPFRMYRPTQYIQELVAVSYGARPRIMTQQGNSQPAAWIRQIAMYLTREITGRSYPEIGRAFGNRDHTTVIHAVRLVKKRIAEDPQVAEEIAAFVKALSQ